MKNKDARVFVPVWSGHFDALELDPARGVEPVGFGVLRIDGHTIDGAELYRTRSAAMAAAKSKQTDPAQLWTRAELLRTYARPVYMTPDEIAQKHST